MINSIKKIIFALLFNTSFLVVLIIGIQNSIYKNKVNLIVNETIKLPNGFIVGVSFMSGSLLGSFLNINEFFKKEKN